ncbi:MAG: hypothetical protein NC548_59875 [Lachnospiraceae bacterium]|nr:hypothetical protein [Lachnospiraceae bacterium]
MNIDMTDDEQFKKGLAKMQCVYYASAGGQEIEFTLPFLARVMNMPKIKVYVEDQPVEGEILYGGDRAFFYEDIDVEEAMQDAYSTVFDESINGTLYEVIPDAETITVALTLSQGQSLIYETSNQLQSSHSARHLEITMHNALMKSKYEFFIIGEPLQEVFSASCEVQKREMTCKAYIDETYVAAKEYYENYGNPPVEFLYSQVNAIMAKKQTCKFEDLFFDAITRYRVNFFKFRAFVSENTRISFSNILDIQYDSHYSPKIYRIKQIHAGDYLVDFTIKLNESNPYILLNSGANQPTDGQYRVECSGEDFSCTFSSTSNPVNRMLEQREQEAKDARTRLIVAIVCGVVGGAAFIALVGIPMWYFYPRFRKRR